MLSELQQTVSQITLTLDNPQSVRTQMQRLDYAQREIARYKNQLEIRAIRVNQASPHTFFSIFFDIFGKKRAAGSSRAHRRRQIKRNKQALKQPLQELKNYCDQVNAHTKELKIIAQQYLDDPSINPSIPPTPQPPKSALTNNVGLWLGSLASIMAGIRALGTISFWSWLSAPFLIVGGLCLIPYLRLKIKGWLAERINQEENILNAIAIVSIALGVLFTIYADSM